MKWMDAVRGYVAVGVRFKPPMKYNGNERMEVEENREGERERERNLFLVLVVLLDVAGAGGLDKGGLGGCAVGRGGGSSGSSCLGILDGLQRIKKALRKESNKANSDAVII